MKIDDSRGGAGPALNIRGGTNSDESYRCAMRDGLGDGVLGVDGQDLAVDQNRVRSLGTSNRDEREK